MTKQFLQETNFQEDEDPTIPERRAKAQLNRPRWTPRTESEEEDDTDLINE